MPSDVLESEIEAIYKRIALPTSVMAELREQMNVEVQNRSKRIAAERENMARRLGEAEGERQKLMAAYYANAIDVDVLKTEQNRVNGEIRLAKERLEQVEGDLDGWHEILESAMAFAAKCDRAYKKASDHERRLLNNAIFEKIEVRDGKIVEVSFAEPFDVLFFNPEFE